jgi:prepilin-type N-terminal cleavage/methylation domain-containing protein
MNINLQNEKRARPPRAQFSAPSRKIRTHQDDLNVHVRFTREMLAARRGQQRPWRSCSPAAQSGFTMIEIAISLAIIGIALVAIIGVLPLGMNVQRANREITVINQDANVFLQAIAGGVHGLDDLTNYVYAIVNTGSNPSGYINPTLAGQVNFSKANFPSVPAGQWYSILTNGANIVGLMSTPEYVDSVSANLATNLFTQNYNSNHVVACVRSLSGSAAEKPPQDNSILIGDSLGYRILCVNAPVMVDTNLYNPVLYPNGPPAYIRQQAANLHELRLTFLWPTRPNGSVGNGRQTFRIMVPGQILHNYGSAFYFYQSQSFTNAP